MVNSEKFIGDTEYLTRCRTKRCRYNRVRLYMGISVVWLKVPKKCFLTFLSMFYWCVILRNSKNINGTDWLTNLGTGWL